MSDWSAYCSQDDTIQRDREGRRTPSVPISADELRLMRELQARKADGKFHSSQRHNLGRLPGTVPLDPDHQSPFPDLPPELKPQRADGTGMLTYRDIEEIERSGGVPFLDKVTARRAQIAVEHLQEKMARTAHEFSEGLINHAQFQAVYTRYAEQRAMIERIRVADPRSMAWQESVQPRGETAYLRQQLAARATGCVIIENQHARIVRSFGLFDLNGDLLVPILYSLQNRSLRANGQREISTQIDNGQWLSLVPGDFTTTIVIYSGEPSAAQRYTLADLHRDFEQANSQELQEVEFAPSELVYPQRTLFDD